MSDTDQTSADATPAQAPAQTPAPVLPPDPGYPAYAAPAQPSFWDRVVGMRAVIAVALASLIIGGLSGFILGEHTGGNDGRGGFPGGPGFRGGQQTFPGQQGQQGQPPFGQGQSMR